MELDLDLLKEICANYGVEVIENEPGGFIFSNNEYNEILKSIKLEFKKSKLNFNGYEEIEKVVFDKVSIEKILDVREKKEKILKDLHNIFVDFKFGFLENKDFEFYLLYKITNSIYYDKFDKRKFKDELYLLCEKYLNDDELEELVIIYDYADKL